MAVSRMYHPNLLGMARPCFFKGAKVPSEPPHDYFNRYPALDAYNALTFKYTPKKRFLFINIHCGTVEKQNPHTDGFKINGVAVPFIFGGNPYYTYPCVLTALYEAPDLSELTFDLSLGGNGRKDMGNGGIHIMEFTHVDMSAGIIGHFGDWSNSGMGWSLGWQNDLQVGDILAASAFTQNFKAHPIRGINRKKGDVWDTRQWDVTRLSGFSNEGDNYAVGAAFHAYKQADFDEEYFDASISYATGSSSSMAHIKLRGAIF